MRAYDLTVTGSAVVSGSVTASYFKGDGTGITGVTAEWDGTHTGDGNITGVLTFGSLTDGSITIADFKDQDNLSSDSATSLATQQSIKAYVDAQVTAQDLDFQGDSGGALSIDLDSESLTIAGGTNATTVGSGNGVTINVDDSFLVNDASDTTSGTITAAGFDAGSGIITTSGNITGSNVSGTISQAIQTGITTAANLTTVGTIGSGTWEGTTVAVAQGGTGATSLSDLITLGDHTTGNYVGTLTGGLGITSTGATSGEGIAHSISVDSTPISGSWRGYITGSGIVSASSIASSAQGQVALTTNGVAATAVDLGLQAGDSPTFANITATGMVTAREFHTQFVSASIVYQSGSTKFGDTSDDVHSFTGSIHLINSGSVSGSQYSTGSFGRFEGSTLQGTIVTPSQTNITSVGTIGTGTWEGTTVAVDQGGTGATSLNNLITLGTHTTGNYVSTVVAGSGIDVSGATGDVTISIGTGEVVNAMIGDDEINSEHYAAGSIDNEHLADDAVDSDELAAGAVDDAHLSDGVATGLAGTGTTATSGVINVIGGDGITANADDVAVTAAQTTITSVLNTGLVVGRDADNDIDFATDNNIIFRAGGEDQLTLVDGALTPSSNAIVDLGTDALEFKDAYFDGTVEADAITIAGVTLSETIADTIGAMVENNTETNIAVTYEDSDNTLDFVIGTLNQDTSGTAAIATTATVADTTDTTCYVGLWESATGNLGAKSDAGLTYNAGTGMLTATGLTGPLTGQAATVATITGLAPDTATTQATQGNITSLGTLTALTVDDIAVDGKVVTMTGSSGDTATLTVGTDGTLDIVTTDTAAAAANIQITADGTAELAGTTVTLDSAGDIELEGTYVNLTGTGLSFTNQATLISLNNGNNAALTIEDGEGGNAMLVFDTNGGVGSVADVLVGESGGSAGQYSLSPAADDVYDLGGASNQWRNIYTGDLHLNNTRGSGNEVDGTSGSWTIQEGADDLFLINRETGKKFKFKLEEIE